MITEELTKKWSSCKKIATLYNKSCLAKNNQLPLIVNIPVNSKLQKPGVLWRHSTFIFELEKHTPHTNDINDINNDKRTSNQYS